MLSLRSIPIKNIKAHPVRSLILFILTLAQAASVFGGLMTVQGMRQELARAEARLGADVLVYPTAAFSKIGKDGLLMQGTPVEVYRDREILSRMDACEDISAVTYQIYLSAVRKDGGEIRIIGYEPETDFVIAPWFAGRNVPELQEGSIAAGIDVEVNESGNIVLYGREWPVEARLEKTGSLLDGAVFVPLETLESMLREAEAAGDETYASVHPAEDFSAALIRVDNRDRVQAVTDWINIYVRKVTAVRSEETLTQTAAGIRGTTKTMAAASGLAWLVLLIALGTAQILLMKERKKELYVWLTVGAHRGIMSRVILTEALLLHLTGAAAGVLLAGILVSVFRGKILPGVVFSVPGCLAAAAGAVLLASAAGIIAAFLSLKRTEKNMSGQMLLTI